MPEMSEENYNALMEKLAKLEERSTALEKRITDVVAFNNTLLHTTSDGHITVDAKERHKELEQKLKGVFNHA